MNVEKIGKKKAERIRRTITEEYDGASVEP